MEHDLEKMRSAAVKELNEIADSYEVNHACFNKELYLEDSRDLRNIAYYLQERNDKLASSVAQRLDTAVRDNIPCVAWELLGFKPLPHFEAEYKRLVEEALSGK